MVIRFGSGFESIYWFGGEALSKILPVEKSSIIDRGGVSVNVWVQNNKNECEISSQNLFFTSGADGLLEKIRQMVQTAKNTVFIVAPRIDEIIKNEILKAAQSGVRVYVLLEKNGFDAWTRSGDEAMAEQIICRQSSQSVPSILLIDTTSSNPQGLLLQPSTPIDRALKVKGTAWGLSLNSLQISNLAHHCSWMFWSVKGGRKETRCAKHLKSPQDVEPLKAELITTPPSDVIRILPNDATQKVFTNFNKVQQYSTLGFSAYDLKEIEGVEILKKLHTAVLPEPGEVSSGSVSSHTIAHTMTAVLSADQKSGWLFDWIPDARLQSSHHVCMRLDTEQTQSITEVMTSISAFPEWSLKRNVLLSTLRENSTVRLENGVTTATIFDTETINLGIQSVPAWSKDRLEEYEPHPSTYPNCSPLAKSVTWIWTNSPPRPPQNVEPALIERQFKAFVEKASKTEIYLRKRLDSHGAKGKKFIKMLDKAFPKKPELVRNTAILQQWSGTIEKIVNELQALENQGDSDIERKSKTTKIEIPEAPHSNRPSVGQLLAQGKTQYLVINSWDEFKDGMIEAKARNAELVASRG